MKLRVGLLVVVVIVMGAAAACSDDEGESAATTTTVSRGFEVQTPEGQASLSLTGELPPNWPSDFPVPGGAEPAGSGSLGGSSSSTWFVGVYSTSQSPQDAYTFYAENSDFQIDSASSIGTENAYLGTVQFSGEWNGYVVTLPYNDETLIVVLLNQTATGTTTAGSGTTAAT